MKKTLLTITTLLLFSSVCLAKNYGIASFYYRPQNTASGKWFTPNKMWAAHKTLPLGTKVKVTNVKNQKSVIVTIWDRGPYKKGRVIDLSKSAFSKIADTKKGLCTVNLKIVD